MTTQALEPTPLLGVAGQAGHVELRLAAKFDALHQLIYTQGGIRPTNAAIEEITKLILLRLWVARDSQASIDDPVFQEIFYAPSKVEDLVATVKRAFARAIQSPWSSTQDLAGHIYPLWPLDEPFRITNTTVLREALTLVDEIINHDIRVADPLGTAFDAFLSGRYDHAGGLGTYLTPSGVARSMAEIALEIADPLADWDGKSPIIADPFCGTGRFLVSIFDSLKERGVDKNLLEPLLNRGLFGADQSASAIAKTATNLLLYGSERPLTARVADSVTDPSLDRLQGHLKLILTNPPFGGQKYGSIEGIHRTARRASTLANKVLIDPALAGLVRSLDLVAPKGVVGIVLPDGVIEGRYFQDILTSRDLPNQHVAVVASVSLPSATFSLSGTVAKTSAVFLQKRTNPRRTVLAKVNHVGFIKQAGKAAPDPEGNELPLITHGVSNLLQRAAEDTPIVTLSEKPLIASIANEHITSYDTNRIDPAAMESKGKIQAGKWTTIRSLASASRVRRARELGDEPFVSVLHVDDFGTIRWHEAMTYEPATLGQLVSAEQVIISLLNPSKLRAAVIPSNTETVQCSTEFGVLTPQCDPYALLGLLYNPDVQAQLRPLGRGTSSSRRRISVNDVLDLVIPKLDSRELEELAEQVRSGIAAIDIGRSSLLRAYSPTS